MAGVRRLGFLAVALASVNVGLTLPSGELASREGALETHAAGLKGGAQVDISDRQDELLMMQDDTAKAASDENRDSREDGVGIRDIKPKGGADFTGKVGTRGGTRTNNNVGPQRLEIHRLVDTDGAKSLRPLEPERLSGTMDQKSRVFSGSNRLPKEVPLRRGGDDVEIRAKLQSKDGSEPLRGASDIPGRKVVKSLRGALEEKTQGNTEVGKSYVYKLSTDTNAITIECPDFDVSCDEGNLSINKKSYCGNNKPSKLTFTVLKIELESQKQKPSVSFRCKIVEQDSCCGKSGSAGRIVGGSSSDVRQFPWQVGLVDPYGWDGAVFCGGSIVNSKFVVTAAHCTDGKLAGRINVLLGLHDRRETSEARKIAVQRILQHSEYNLSPMDKDISLLLLSEHIHFSDKMRPVCLPRGNDPYNNVEVTVSGWGTLSSGGSQPSILHDVAITTLTNQQCAQAYGESLITKNMLCTYKFGKDSCQGDSGGPLVRTVDGRATQIGVVSFGAGCAEYPGVYVRMTELMEWIDDTFLDGHGGQTC